MFAGALAFLAKPLIKWGIIAAVVAVLSVTIVILYQSRANAILEKENALHDLQIATDANKELAKDIDNMLVLRNLEAKATAEEINRTETQTRVIEKLKKELRSVEGSNNRAGPYYDNLGERLRNLSEGSGNN